MEKFDSISHFLQTESFQYRIYDMGRKVCEISSTLFEQVENQQSLYPYPFQQKAWLALLFWPEAKEEEAVIWFLQFPIDELGFLKQASRDAFLIDVLEQTGKNIQAKQKGNEIKDGLGESPFAFKPREDRLAMFHALATVTLGQKPSQHYQYAHDYISNKDGLGFEHWQFLGLQGIADLVSRLQSDENEVALCAAIEELPEMPLNSFAHALENIEISSDIFNALVSRLTLELEESSPNIPVVSALVRSISSYAPLNGEKFSILNKVLASPISLEIELMAAISGRSWLDLRDAKLLSLFLNKLAEQEQMAFSAILADLIMIPDMRELVLAEVRSETRSLQLATKFGEFMQVVAK